MSQATGQLLLAIVGVVGTLAAAITTQILQRRAERERRAAEDARRWHADRFRVFKELLYKVTEVDRILGSAYAMLPSDEERRSLRQAGHTTFAGIPADAVPPHAADSSIFDAFCLEEIKEALTSCFALNEEAERLLAEISILSAGDVPARAREMFEATWYATGALESTRGSNADAWNDFVAMRPPISAFEAAVRSELGVVPPRQRYRTGRMLGLRRRHSAP
ncbi:hypothetical protein ACWGF3_12885 [Streptomyces xanthophaeus]